VLAGSVIVFTALLSIVLLKKRPKIYQWIGIFAIIGRSYLLDTRQFLRCRLRKPF
jgi:drug/metabolite transporter (DMT)-like permease